MTGQTQEDLSEEYAQLQPETFEQQKDEAPAATAS